MKIGCVVYSLSGHDKNTFMAVVGEKEGYILLADGKRRPLERPKLKNIKHIKVTDYQIQKEQLISNKSLRRALYVYAKLKEDSDNG